MTEEEQWAQDCIRHPAWEKAHIDYIENGMASDGDKWKRCVISGDMSLMDDGCWSLLIAAYPA